MVNCCMSAHGLKFQPARVHLIDGCRENCGGGGDEATGSDQNIISGAKPLICRAVDNDIFRLPRSDNARMALIRATLNKQHDTVEK